MTGEYEKIPIQKIYECRKDILVIWERSYQMAFINNGNALKLMYMDLFLQAFNCRDRN